jgi:phage terminase small subunit
MAKLTPKQEEFCRQFLLDLNSTQAAIRAGYSPKTAEKIGWENQKKPEIKARIDELRLVQQDRTRISVDWIIKKLANIAGFELNQIGNFDGEKMVFKPEADWSKGARTAVSSIKQTLTTRRTQNGDEFTTSVIELKIESKQSALDSLAKHYGMYDNFNIAIATLKTYGINIIRNESNEWIIDRGE